MRSDEPGELPERDVRVRLEDLVGVPWETPAMAADACSPVPLADATTTNRPALGDQDRGGSMTTPPPGRTNVSPPTPPTLADVLDLARQMAPGRARELVLAHLGEVRIQLAQDVRRHRLRRQPGRAQATCGTVTRPPRAPGDGAMGDSTLKSPWAPAAARARCVFRRSRSATA